jgi:hypothetical protein
MQRHADRRPDAPSAHGRNASQPVERHQQRPPVRAVSWRHTNLRKSDVPISSARPSPDATDPVVAVCDTQEAAQSLVAALNRAGFDMTKVSLVGKGNLSPEHAHGFFTIGDRVKSWASTGSLWGAGWGLMLGAAIVVMPPIGVVVAAGPFVAMLLAVLEGAAVVGGVSAIAAVLTDVGLSPEHAANYESDVKADRFLVIIHGSAEDIARARTIAENSRD